MNEKFKLSQTVFVILFFVFVFGLLLEITRSEYVLRYHPEIHREEIKASHKKLPETLKSALQRETYLVVTNPNSPNHLKLKDNIIQTLKYMQKQVVETPVTALPQDMKKYSGVIITFEEIDLIADMSKVEKYVEEGGSVFFAMRPSINDTLYHLYRKLGIYEIGGFTTAHGISLTSNILIKQKGLYIDEEFLENSSLALGLEPSCRVHAKSVNNIPLLWDVPYYKGRFVVFNGTILNSKDNRGLIAGSISLMKDEFIYPIINMKIANIDDFPAPFPEGYNNKIFKETRMKTDRFYRHVWWPFIQKGAMEYDVKYSGYIIQTYNNRVIVPFSEDPGVQQDNLIKYGRELLKMGGELGIHGYNHQSLTTDSEKVRDLNYKPWRSQDDMEKSLMELDQYVKSAFPSMEVKSYVPPSNIIDESGLSAIRTVFPSVNVISSIYLEDPANRSYVQEFTYDGNNTHLPRITSGYEFTNETKWSIANSITSIGVFSHFIHPDDFLDEERSNSKGWGQLSNEYNFLLQSIKKNYPWLRSVLPSEASTWVKQYSQTTIYTEKKDNKLIVYSDNFSGELYFLFRTNKKIGMLKDCTVNKIDDDVYLVTAKKEIFEIGLDE